MKDEAFDCLERAIRLHDENVTFLKVNPELHPLRSDPRFAFLLKKARPISWGARVLR